MEYLFIFAALLLFIGSISIALPSKSSRKISKVRMNAKLLGCRISSILYGENKFKNLNSLETSYQVENKTNLLDGHFIRDKEQLILYSPVKLKYSNSFESLNNQLQDTSNSLSEVIFTKTSILFLWDEKDGIEELKNILQKFNELKFF